MKDIAAEKLDEMERWFRESHPDSGAMVTEAFSEEVLMLIAEVRWMRRLCSCPAADQDPTYTVPQKAEGPSGPTTLGSESEGKG